MTRRSYSVINMNFVLRKTTYPYLQPYLQFYYETGDEPKDTAPHLTGHDYGYNSERENLRPLPPTLATSSCA